MLVSRWLQWAKISSNSYVLTLLLFQNGLRLHGQIYNTDTLLLCSFIVEKNFKSNFRMHLTAHKPCNLKQMFCIFANDMFMLSAILFLFMCNFHKTNWQKQFWTMIKGAVRCHVMLLQTKTNLDRRDLNSKQFSILF